MVSCKYIMQVYYYISHDGNLDRLLPSESCSDADARKTRRTALFARIAKRHYPEAARELDSALLVRQMRDER